MKQAILAMTYLIAGTAYSSDLIEEPKSFGVKTPGQGNIVSLQPYMAESDFRSQEAFYGKLDSYFQEMKAQGWMSHKTVVVLPEYIGLWLVAVDERDSTYNPNRTSQSAMTAVATRHLPRFAISALKVHARDKTKGGLFLMKAQKMAEIYNTTFSGLARHYGVTIVAGSTVLPNVRWDQQGRIRVYGNKLYNLTVVYRPDGTPDPNVTKKVFIPKDEEEFVTAGRLDDLKPYDTPAGRLGVLICADSWQPATYQKLRSQGVQILAVPTYILGDDSLSQIWTGQHNVIPADAKPYLGKITYQEARERFTLPGRFPLAGVKYAVNPFLRGHFWELGSDGGAFIVADGHVTIEKHVHGAALQNIWISEQLTL